MQLYVCTFVTVLIQCPCEGADGSGSVMLMVEVQKEDITGAFFNISLSWLTSSFLHNSSFINF
jgi:hypothetical protein